MRILFAISVLCLFALCWALVSMARHVGGKKGLQRRAGAQAQEFDVVLRELLEGDADLLRTKPSALSRQNVTRRRSGGALTVTQDLPERPAETLPKSGFALPERKPPQAVRTNAHGVPLTRLDRAYFNKDLGDLSDPYEPSGRYAESAGWKATRG